MLVTFSYADNSDTRANYTSIFCFNYSSQIKRSFRVMRKCIMTMRDVYISLNRIYLIPLFLTVYLFVRRDTFFTFINSGRLRSISHLFETKLKVSAIVECILLDEPRDFIFQSHIFLRDGIRTRRISLVTKSNYRAP